MTDHSGHQGHSHDIDVPPAALLAVGVLIAVALLAAYWGRWGPPADDAATETHSVFEQQRFTFTDQPGGAVGVHDFDADNRLVAAIQPEDSSFIRGVLRSLALDRRQLGIGPEVPFELSLWSDGRLTLKDSGTNRVLDLAAFGSTNQGDFRALLELEPGTPLQTTQELELER